MTFALRVFQFCASREVSETELLGRVARAGPGFCVVLRDPELDTRSQLELGRRLRLATRAVGARLLVSDRLDLAQVLDADGVHLGRASVSVEEVRRVVAAWFITRSAHDAADLTRAAAERADAVILSPVFASPDKGEPLGLDALFRARRRLPQNIALVALGGVTAGNAASCFDAGADAVASIRADLSGQGY